MVSPHSNRRSPGSRKQHQSPPALGSTMGPSTNICPGKVIFLTSSRHLPIGPWTLGLTPHGHEWTTQSPASGPTTGSSIALHSKRGSRRKGCGGSLSGTYEAAPRRLRRGCQAEFERRWPVFGPSQERSPKGNTHIPEAGDWIARDVHALVTNRETLRARRRRTCTCIDSRSRARARTSAGRTADNRA
jgi:hypothetical protein